MRKFYVIYSQNINLTELKNAFRHQNVHFVPLVRLKSISKAARSKNSIVIAAGGDGTINAVANMIAGSAATMGVVPLGTLNHFAKDMGIPLEVDKAITCIFKAHTIKVDVGEVNDRVFVNNSSLGIYPASLRTRSEFTPHVGKWPAALLGVARAIARSHAYRVTLTADTKKIERTTPFIFVGNNSYRINDFGFTNRATLTAGTLCVYLVRANTAWKLIKVLLRALVGKLHASRDFETFLTTEVVISTKRKLHVSLDGELVRLKSPLHYYVRAKGLRVIVPMGQR